MEIISILICYGGFINLYKNLIISLLPFSENFLNIIGVTYFRHSLKDTPEIAAIHGASYRIDYRNDSINKAYPCNIWYWIMYLLILYQSTLCSPFIVKVQ